MSRVMATRRNLIASAEALCAFRGVDAEDEEKFLGAMIEAEYMIRVSSYLRGGR